MQHVGLTTLLVLRGKTLAAHRIHGDTRPK